MHQRAGLLVEVDARVEGVDRDAGRDGLLDCVGMSASGVTRVVAMPSTLESMAFWIRTACLVASGSEEYFRVDAGVLGGLLGPGLDRSQKVSPGVSWVTMAKV